MGRPPRRCPLPATQMWSSWPPNSLGLRETRRSAEIADALPAASVVVIGSSPDEDELIDAIRGGAAGYLRGDSSTTALLRAVRGAASGDVILSRADARRLVRRVTGGQSPNGSSLKAASRLSARERKSFDFFQRHTSPRDRRGAVYLGPYRGGSRRQDPRETRCPESRRCGPQIPGSNLLTPQARRVTSRPQPRNTYFYAWWCR